MNKKTCPCCGYKTLDTSLRFEICPVCFWEDDEIQNKDPSFAGGANSMSINEARKSFKKFGAVEKDAIKHVRAPNEKEK